MARQSFLVGCAALIFWCAGACGYSQQYHPSTSWIPQTGPPSYYTPPTDAYGSPPNYSPPTYAPNPVPDAPVFDMGRVPYVAQVPLEEQTLPPPLGSSIPAELLPDEALAATETESWVLPNMWFNPVDWDGGLEVGINGTDGNSQTFSMRSGGNLKRKTEFHELSGDITYLRTEAGGIETQHNAIANGKYERYFGDVPWSLFFKDMLEYDEFKAFDLRLVMNMGLSYQYIKTDTMSLKGRFGAGTSHEFGGPDDEWVPELVYGADFDHQLSKRQIGRAHV